LGNVIIIGRGGSIITAKLPDVLHVRLVAPLDKRIAHACEAHGMTETDARAFCLREDRGRKRYLEKYFHADNNDPLHYHLIINTGVVSYDEAARLIGDTLVNLE
jgi:CMP/dCMP kinase